MRVITAVLAAAIVFAGVGGADAVAAPQPLQISPGVFVDPSSPVAKEYALQLQQARGTGSRPPAARSGSSPSVLFGSGIAPPGQTSADNPVRGATRPRSQQLPTVSAGGSRAFDPSAQNPSPADPAPVQSAPQAPRPSLGSGGAGAGTLALVGGAAAIVVLGGLGGVLLRRHRSLDQSA